MLKTVKSVGLVAVPVDENIISSHVLYKMKHEDSESLKLRARIAPYGNEDAARTDLRRDCSMCASSGVRLLVAIEVLMHWRIVNLNVKSADLQAGRPTRDVYVIPPVESKDYGKCMWLLRTETYGLVNANSKLKVQSDQPL